MASLVGKGEKGAPIMLFAVHLFSSCGICLPRKAGLAALWDAFRAIYLAAVVAV